MKVDVLTLAALLLLSGILISYIEVPSFFQAKTQQPTSPLHHGIANR